MSISRATDLASQLGQLDRMEELLQSASSPAALGEIDLDQVRAHMGEDAARALDRLAKLTKSLADAGLIEQQGGPDRAHARGRAPAGPEGAERPVRPDQQGPHRRPQRHVAPASGHDREETTKAYEYGDPLNLHLSTTVHNAVRRGGSGVPVRLTPEDFEVVETEALARSATVLLVDLSMSMPMRDNFVPAKKMAMALQTLISSQFPRDYLGIVGFSEVAREIRPDELPTAMWDYVYGTNLQHALALARRMLAHQHGTKQIIVVTDGEPTAHIDDYGEVSSTTRRCPRRCAAPWPRSSAAPGPASSSTPSPSTSSAPTTPSSSRSPGSTGGAPSTRPPTPWAATCWSTSSSTAGSCAPPAEPARRPDRLPGLPAGHAPAAGSGHRVRPGRTDGTASDSPVARHEPFAFPLAFRDGW